LEFTPGSTLTFTATPASGKAEVQDGSFRIEADMIYATLPQGVR